MDAYVCLTVILSVFLSVCLSVRHPVCPSVGLSVICWLLLKILQGTVLIKNNQVEDLSTFLPQCLNDIEPELKNAKHAKC